MKGKREEKEGGGADPLPSLIRNRPWGARSLSSLFPLKPNKAHILPGEFPYLSGTPKNTRITRNLSDVRI